MHRHPACNTDSLLPSVSSRIKKKGGGGGGGGVEHLQAVYALAHNYIASLYYYPVLREHGKRGGCCRVNKSSDHECKL